MQVMAMLPRMTRKARENYHYLAETLREVEFHLRGRIDASGLIPPEWQEIACARGPMPKVKINLWVEGEVVKFFKGTGRGWSTRMAEVLRIFMQARLADVLRGAEGVDYSRWEGEERRHRLDMLREALRLEAEIGAEAAEKAAAGKAGPRPA
jgi:uncharacterized protein (DUF4415 family)